MKNKMDYTDMVTGKKLTKKQLEVLMLLNPFEKKTTYFDTAKKLGITESAVQKRMCQLKKRCPTVYEKFMKLKKNLNKKPDVVQISQLCPDEEQNECFDYLRTKEVF